MSTVLRRVLPAVLLVVPACKDRGAPDSAPQGQVAEAGVGPADPAACENYAKEVCGKAGEQSSACASFQEAAAVMPPAACAAGLAEVGYTEAKLAEANKVCDDLVAKLCGDLGQETDTCKMVQAKSRELGAEQCAGMMGEYPQVLAELQAMEKANQPLGDDEASLIAAGDLPTFGPTDAKVTVVEFSDFQCPFCSRAADAVTQVKEKYSDKARFVFRQFPLSFHEDAHLAAQAALAAHAQGKFWPFHDLLFKNQSALGREELENYAQEAGLDVAKFKSDLDNRSYAQQVDDDLELGKKVYVNGTPTIFVNGKRVENATDFGAISSAIDDALAAAG